ncbi:hypothetical protein AB6F55_17540 [Providencia hangzhouensis]
MNTITVLPECCPAVGAVPLNTDLIFKATELATEIRLPFVTLTRDFTPPPKSISGDGTSIETVAARLQLS